MLKSGWFRLWAVLSCVLLLSVAVASAYYIWGVDSCYRFISVSIEDGVKEQDQVLAKSVERELLEKPFCGQTQSSPLLTLEDLAQRGVVTQVGVQWLEPAGWTFTDHDMLDVLDKGEIKSTEIIGRTTGYVRSARLTYSAKFIIAALLLCFLALALGIGVAWIRRGFRNGGA